MSLEKDIGSKKLDVNEILKSLENSVKSFYFNGNTGIRVKGQPGLSAYAPFFALLLEIQ